MQNDVYGCYDEVEPRTMPRPASKFDSRPFPMVPEVSLILDKPQQSKKMDDTLANTVPEVRTVTPRDSTNTASESYAAWKEKQFPQQSNRTPPNRSNQVYSPIQNTRNSQDTHGLRQSVKSYNTMDSADYNYKNQSSGNESPRKFSITRSSGHIENPNKYTLSYARNSTENDHHVNNIYNHTSRSNNRDESGSPNVRRRSDHSHERETYDVRQKSSPNDRRRHEHSHETEIYDIRQKPSPNDRRRSDHSHETEIYDTRQKSSPNDRRQPEYLHEMENYDMRPKSSPNDRRRSDYSRAIETYDIRQKTSPYDRRQSDHSQAVEAYDIRQKPRLHRSSSYSNADSYAHRTIPMDNTYQSKHSRSLQPVKYSPERNHHYPGCCTSKHNSSHSETETVKNLLQVITSQNEQIKNLQKQVERLLKLHEQSLRDRNQCTCQPNGIIYQNTQMYDQSRTANLPISRNNLMKDNERCFTDLKLQDEKNKQTILEQKVSIGVMTSFELKVQNNPSILTENEVKQKNHQEKMLPGLETSNMIKNLVNDTGEMIRKKPHFFQPTPLENISEASESHMSSLRQSHLCPESTRQSIEAHDSIEIQNSNFYKQNFQENENMQMRDRNFEENERMQMLKQNFQENERMQMHKQNFRENDNMQMHKQNLRENENMQMHKQHFRENENMQMHKQHFQENENMQMHKESTKPMNQSRDRRARRPTNLDYEIKEPTYERTNNDIQEIPTYQYNLPYENLGSSPDEDLKEKKADEYNAEPLMSAITKMKSAKCDNFADECLSLSSSELDVEDPSPPSPEPSIHLDMQEYSESGSLPPQRAQKVGWTLYNNVLDQVNQILQNSPMNDDPEQESSDGMRSNERKEYDSNVIMDTVKAATLEQLTKLGISFSENVDQREPNYNKRVVFDASYYSRQGPEAHIATTSGSIETNTSMHMKALAKKYLNDDQLADMAMQKPRTGALKPAPNNVQNTNMSFATMHYLQRYHLLPGNNSSPSKEAIREDYTGPSAPVINERLAMNTAERRAPSPHRYPAFTGNSKGSYPSKILDISTLKQQPKLL